MFGLGVGEFALIGATLVLLLGPKKIPELGQSIGKSLRNFKEETK